MHISESKRRLRLDINLRIERMTERQRHAEGRTVSRVLLEHIPKGSTVSAYFPLKNEVDIRLLLEELLKRGDTLYLPAFARGMLTFRGVERLMDLSPGAFTIPEPSPTSPELSDTPLDIALIPGCAFDRKGSRLGRGNGGFDRWIENQRKCHPTTRFIGVCLECQLIDHVPMESHDQYVDAVVTARGVIECKM